VINAIQDAEVSEEEQWRQSQMSMSPDVFMENEELFDFDVDPSLLEDEEACQADMQATHDLAASDLARLASLSADEDEPEMEDQVSAGGALHIANDFLNDEDNTYWVQSGFRKPILI
jgi:hypothetical protein